MSELIPTNAAARYGILMVGCVIGAVVLLALRALPGFVAFIVGALLLFFGFGILSSKKSKDRLPGLVCIASGALTILSKFSFLKHPAGWLLKAGAVALFVVGIWNGVQFVLALKNRA